MRYFSAASCNTSPSLERNDRHSLEIRRWLPASLLLLFLLFCARDVYSQINDDSLIKTCVSLPDEYKTNELKQGKILVPGSSELFSGMFSGIKLFSISYGFTEPSSQKTYFVEHGYQQLCAINKYSGKIADLKNYSDFNKAIDRNAKINTLDKCYFYLLLNGIEKIGLTHPDEYKNSIRKYSALYKNMPFSFISRSVISIDPESLYKHYILLSTQRKIYMGVHKFVNGKKLLKIYKFSFDTHNNLIKHSLIFEDYTQE